MEKGRKNDQSKLRMDLIPPEVEEALAAVLTYGSLKYGDNNWRQNLNTNRIYGALRRHLSEWRKDCEVLDEETGLPHIVHALCNMVFLVWYDYTAWREETYEVSYEDMIKQWKKDLGVSDGKEKS